MKTLEDAMAAIETMRAEHEAEKASILKKNKELIDREKTAKAAADAAEEARDEAATDAAAKAGDIETIKAQLTKKHNAEIAKLQLANATYETRLSELLIDNTVNEAIAKNGVLPHFAPAVTAMLKSGAKMENGEAMIDGVPFAEKITSWFGSEEARHYVAAPVNSGGGAQGSNAKALRWLKPPELEQMAEWTDYAVGSPAEANSLAKGWNRPDLEV